MKSYSKKYYSLSLFTLNIMEYAYGLGNAVYFAVTHETLAAMVFKNIINVVYFH